MSLRGRAQIAPHAVSLRQFLVVACGKTRFALAADIVRGLAHPEETVTAVGKGPAMTDLAARFGLSRSPRAPQARIVFCGRREVHHAFLVDEVVGLTEVEVDRIRPLPSHFAGPERAWFTGLYVTQEAVVLVVDPGWLLDFYPTPPPPAVVNQSESGNRAPGLPGPTDVTAVPIELLNVEGIEQATDAEDTPWAEL
ncbi:MAG: chemotaxis protein CheW [Nitrospirae bacterium]|nr:chemotaxis protein CheW [Nitrospirota bacterium]